MFHTLELGGRWRPQLNGWAQPYMDLRVAYGMSRDGYADPFFATAGSVPAGAVPSGRANSGGLGAVAGAGFDVPLSQWVSLTGGLSGSMYRMSNVRISGRDVSSDFAYSVNIIRLNMGITYNPHHLVRR